MQAEVKSQMDINPFGKSILLSDSGRILCGNIIDTQQFAPNKYIASYLIPTITKLIC